MWMLVIDSTQIQRENFSYPPQIQRENFYDSRMSTVLSYILWTEFVLTMSLGGGFRI